MKLDVVICTHNPRSDYWERVIAALREQTLEPHWWSLLIVDNASDECLVEAGVQWHPNANIVREPALGLVNARARAIRETQGDVITFVDDDNVLASDYLANVLEIADTRADIGAWSGRLVPEFEVQPPTEVEQILGGLGIREFDRDIWSNVDDDWRYLPWGAGMCVRRPVADQFLAGLADARRGLLGVKGSQLMRCEDLDLALSAVDIGLGTGIFTSLCLTHLMPASRTDLGYLADILEGDQCSSDLLRFIRTGVRPPARGLVHRVLDETRAMRADPITRLKLRAQLAGRRRALQLIASLGPG